MTLTVGGFVSGSIFGHVNKVILACMSQVSTEMGKQTSHPCQLSLAISPWVNAVSTGEVWDEKGYTERYTSPVFVVSQCKLVSGWGLRQVIWAKLTRRAKAYSSSCSQVIVVYLHPFPRNSLFCSQKSPKNHVKSIFLGFKVIQGHRCW